MGSVRIPLSVALLPAAVLVGTWIPRGAPDPNETRSPVPSTLAATTPAEEAPGAARDVASSYESEPRGPGLGPAGTVASASPTDRPPAGSEDVASDPLADWITYRAPNGGTLRHPRGWRVQADTAGLRLLPADGDPDSEWIVVTAQPAPGIHDPADPRIGSALDVILRSAFPALRRSGPSGRARTADGVGASYDYRGRGMRGRVFVGISQGHAVALTIVGDERSFERREEVLEAIFGTFTSQATGPAAGGAPGELAPGLDPRLVGDFAGEAIASGAGTYVNTQLVYRLRADGTLAHGARSYLNVSQGDGRGGFDRTATGSTNASLRTGRWSTSNGIVTVRWDLGGVTRAAYGFEPDGTLALRDPVTRELIDIYRRVR